MRSCCLVPSLCVSFTKFGRISYCKHEARGHFITCYFVELFKERFQEELS